MACRFSAAIPGVVAQRDLYEKGWLACHEALRLMTERDEARRDLAEAEEAIRALWDRLTPYNEEVNLRLADDETMQLLDDKPAVRRALERKP